MDVFYFFGRKSYNVINVIFVDSRMIDSSSKSPKGIEMNVKLLNESYDKKEFLTKIFGIGKIVKFKNFIQSTLIYILFLLASVK